MMYSLSLHYKEKHEKSVGTCFRLTVLLGWQLSCVAIVLGGSCPDGSCLVAVVWWQLSGLHLSRWKLSGYSCYTSNRLMLTNLAWSISRAWEWDYTTVLRLHHRQAWSHGTEGWRDASEDRKICNFFQESGSSKDREKRFGYPVPVWKQFLDIRIRLQTHYPAGYPSGKPDNDHLWYTPSI